MLSCGFITDTVNYFTQYQGLSAWVGATKFLKNLETCVEINLQDDEDKMLFISAEVDKLSRGNKLTGPQGSLSKGELQWALYRGHFAWSSMGTGAGPSGPGLV